MLITKYNFCKYNNILKLFSFNTKSIHKYIYNLRNNIKFIFFYLLKKTYFILLSYKYNLYLFLTRLNTLSINKYVHIGIYDKHIYYFNLYINYFYVSTLLYKNNLYISTKRAKDIFFINKYLFTFFKNNNYDYFVGVYYFFFMLYKHFFFIIYV